MKKLSTKIPLLTAMKKVTSKFSAKIGMVISILSFLLLIVALIASLFESPETMVGVGVAFNFWFFSYVAAFVSLIFYLIDAFCAIANLRRNKNFLFNTILVLVILGSTPMLIFVGAGLGIGILVWNLYYLLLFILEFISIMLLANQNQQA